MQMSLYVHAKCLAHYTHESFQCHFPGHWLNLDWPTFLIRGEVPRIPAIWSLSLLLRDFLDTCPIYGRLSLGWLSECVW